MLENSRLYSSFYSF